MKQSLRKIFNERMEKSLYPRLDLIYRISIILFFLGESINALVHEKKYEKIIFTLGLVVISGFVILIKMKKVRYSRITLLLMFCGEIVAFAELIFQQEYHELATFSVLIFMNFLGLVYLIKSHSAIISSSFANFLLRCFTASYLLIRIKFNLRIVDTFFICILFVFFCTDFLGERKEEFYLTKNDQNLQMLNRESHLNSILSKVNNNTMILDPSFFATKRCSINHSFAALMKNPASKLGLCSINQINSAFEKKIEVFTNQDQLSLPELLLNLKIIETNKLEYSENKETLEDLLKKISLDLLDTKRITNSGEILKGKGTIRMSQEEGEIKERTIQFTIYNFFEDEESCRPRLFLVIKDKTENEENIKLRKLDEFKNQMLATVVHDMRAPLSLIISSLELVSNSQDENEKKENMKLCEINAKYLELLVSDILDFSLFTKNKLNLICTKFAFQSFLEECMSLIKFQANHKNIELRILNEFSTDDFFTDQRRLKQVIINLLTNAVKFTKSGSITLSAKVDASDKNKVQIAVRDTGSGIKKENIEKLGSPFATFDTEEGVNKQGIGLGLFISKTIISQIGPLGMFVVDSKENEGTTISFYVYKFLRASRNKKNLTEGYELNPTLIEVSHSSKVRNRMSCDNEFRMSRSMKSVKAKTDLKTAELDDEINIGEAFQQMNRDKIADNPFLNLKKGETGRLSSASIEFNDLEDEVLLSSQDLDSKSSKFKSELHKMENFRVLIVDDNIFNTIVLESLLRKIGKGKILIEKACDGSDAVEIFKKFNDKDSATPLDFIFMDCLMPVMDGMTATKTIKQLISKNPQQYREVFIAGLTALQCTESEKKECFKSGMDFLFQKPVSEFTVKEFFNNHL